MKKKETQEEELIPIRREDYLNQIEVVRKHMKPDAYVS